MEMARAIGNWRTGGEADVVEGQLADARVELEQQRERLANATGGTEDGDLGGLRAVCQCVLSQWQPLRCPRSCKKLLGWPKLPKALQRTWRADAEKARRWAWAKAFLAANMMDVMECGRRWTG